MSHNVLVVDDEPKLCDLLSSALSQNGIEVFTAGNGLQALAILEQEAIDLVISDWRMPGMDGPQLLAEIKQRYPNLPVIVMTAYSTVKNAVQSMRNGAILDVNLAFERALGYTRQEVLSRRDGFLWLHDEAYAAFSQDRRAHRRTGWHSITGVGRNGQQVSLQICSERDDDADDGLRITVLRVPGHTTSAMPTVYAPLEGGQGA